MEIHQLLAGLHPGDAISNHALALRRLLTSWGHTTEIYARDISRHVAHECRHFSEFTPCAHAAAIYHYSMDFDDVTRLFLKFPGRRLFIYHNITPHHYLASYNEVVSRACQDGRERLAELRSAARVVLGDSEYNCDELADAGFPNPRVLPIFVDLQALDRSPPCQKVLRRFADGWTHFLFVGRLSPNKRQDDVIRLFACYNRTIDRRSRLVLVGTWRGMERYLAELRALVRALDLQDYVVFTGHLAAPELGAHYRRADLFVSMSEHEGFCVPILEAMHFGLPILAYNAAAVPDTLGQTGVLFTRKEFPLLAEMAHFLLTDHGLRERVVLGQADRLADFRPAIVAQRFRAYVDELIAA